MQPPQPDQRHLALHVCVLRGQKALQICVDGHWVQASQPVHSHRASHGCVWYSQWPRQPTGGGGAGGGRVRQSVQPPQPDQWHLALHVCVLRGQKALQICVDGHWVQAPQPVHSHRASHGCVWYSQWPRQPTGGGGAGGGEDTSAVTACMVANTSMTGSWAWVGPVARRLNGSNWYVQRTTTRRSGNFRIGNFQPNAASQIPSEISNPAWRRPDLPAYLGILSVYSGVYSLSLLSLVCR